MIFKTGSGERPGAWNHLNDGPELPDHLKKGSSLPSTIKTGLYNHYFRSRKVE